MKSKIAYLLLIAILLIMIAAVMPGCRSHKEAKEISKLHALADLYPNELAKKCAEKFPVKTQYKTGKTVVLRHTDTIFRVDSVPCPNSDPKIKTVYVKCPPVKSITNTITLRDTLIIENTAQLQVIENERDALMDRFKQEQYKNQVKDDQLKSKTKTIWILGSLLALLCALIVVRIIRRTA